MSGKTIVDAIQVIVIHPDQTYEIKDIAQDNATIRNIIGGRPELVTTPHATFWVNRDRGDLPFNSMATFLWWTLQPEIANAESLAGTVIVTGNADDAADSLPVPHQVIDLYRSMEAVRITGPTQRGFDAP